MSSFESYLTTNVAIEIVGKLTSRIIDRAPASQCVINQNGHNLRLAEDAHPPTTDSVFIYTRPDGTFKRGRLTSLADEMAANLVRETYA